MYRRKCAQRNPGQPDAKLALMLRVAPALTLACLISSLAPLYATAPERDFSGQWFLDARASDTRALPIAPEESLTVSQQDIALHCSSTASDGTLLQWSYLLDGTETRVRIGGETRSSIVKWEGAALLVNTQVSASPDYTMMDRWKLSPDRSVLTITRQVVRDGREVEGALVYSRERQPAAAGTPDRRPAPTLSQCCARRFNLPNPRLASSLSSRPALPPAS